MAKQTPKPAGANAAGNNGPIPYPANWGKMSHSERNEWMRVNRPSRNANAPAPAPAAERPAAQPTAQRAAAMPDGAVPVKLRVARWRLQMGDREPVECESHELGQRIAEEMQSYENENQPDQDDGAAADQDDEF